MVHLVAEADLTTSVWLVLLLGVIAALLITSNDMPILLGVLLIVSFWATIPRSTSMPPRHLVAAEGESDSATPYFAVLGDSYISGEGADVYYEGDNISTRTYPGYAGECRRAPTAWPMLLNPVDSFDEGDLLGVPQRVLFAACSGAVTADVRQNDTTAATQTGGESTDTDARQAQVRVLADTITASGQPAFVFLSVGGNDAQFSDVGMVCIAPYDCDDYVAKVKAAQLPSVGADLRRTYAEVRSVVADDVPVIAVPYPIPVAEADDCRGVVLTSADRDAINTFALALDAEIKRAATDVGLWYMDTMATSLMDTDTQLCAPNGQSGLNFFDLHPKDGSLWAAINPKNWTHNFIHPNQRGHQVMAEAALRWLTTAPPDSETPDPRCILVSSCIALEPAEGVDLATLASEQPSGQADEPRWPPLIQSLAKTAPNAYLTGGLGVLGFWLIITAAVRRTSETGDRRPSVIERTLTSAPPPPSDTADT
jgi:lysophospholipase L1-like esterase